MRSDGAAAFRPSPSGSALRDPNQTVQRTAASRHAEWRCGSRRRLAPVADLCVRHDHMEHCAYIYTPPISEVGIRSFLTGLRAAGVSLTHLGHNDPPRRWSGDDESAASQILGAPDLTVWSFLRDGKSGLELSVQMHRDPSCGHDTISLSGAPKRQIQQLAEAIADSTPHFVAIIGVTGGGKDQAWRVLRMSSECPDRLRSRFTKAEP